MSDVKLLTKDELDNLKWRRHIDNEKGVTHPWARDVDRLLAHIAAISPAAEAYAAPPGDWVLVPRAIPDEVDALAGLEMYAKYPGSALEKMQAVMAFARGLAAPQTPAAPAEEE